MNSENFIRFAKLFKIFKYGHNHADVLRTESFGNDPEAFIENIDFGISHARIFEVEDGIKKLLCLTDVSLNDYEVKLPFETIFLDVHFSKEELKELGINISAEEIIGILVGKGVLLNNKNEKVGTNLRIAICNKVYQYKTVEDEIWFDLFNKNNVVTVDDYKDVKVLENPTTDPIAREFIHKFVLNFLNFLNNPEVEYVEHIRSVKNQERREKNGKVFIYSTVPIRITGKLREYIDEVQMGADWHFNHRFWVRGHFRQLHSDRYLIKKRIWILPYIKGKGILVNKVYHIEEKQNETRIEI